jgi:hypothetical protein
VVEAISFGGSNRLRPLLSADGLVIVEAITGDVALGSLIRYMPFDRWI